MTSIVIAGVLHINTYFEWPSVVSTSACVIHFLN